MCRCLSQVISFFYRQSLKKHVEVQRKCTPVNVQECYLIRFSGKPAITLTFHKYLSFQSLIFTMINFKHVSLIYLSREALKLKCFKQACHTKCELPIESLMGPLLNMVTWYKNHLAGWQIMQWGKKNKAFTSFKKLISFLSRVPFLCMP